MDMRQLTRNESCTAPASSITIILRFNLFSAMWKVLHQCCNPRGWSTSHIRRIIAPLAANGRQPRLSKSSLAMVNFWLSARSQLQILTSNVTFIITNLDNKRWRHYKKKSYHMFGSEFIKHIIFLFLYFPSDWKFICKVLLLKESGWPFELWTY